MEKIPVLQSLIAVTRALVLDTSPGCITGAHMKQQQWIIAGWTTLGSLLVTLLIQAPIKQHTCL